jgi:hypothetical protein
MMILMLVLYLCMMALIIKLSNMYNHTKRDADEKDFIQKRELMQLEYQKESMKHIIDSLSNEEEKVKIITKNKIQYVKEIAIHDTMLLDSIAHSILLKLDSMDRAGYFDSITNQ